MTTIKVRIAVAVDPKGQWNAVGWSTAPSDDDMSDLALEGVGEGERIYWLTAELDVPARFAPEDIPASVDQNSEGAQDA